MKARCQRGFVILSPQPKPSTACATRRPLGLVAPDLRLEPSHLPSALRAALRRREPAPLDSLTHLPAIGIPTLRRPAAGFSSITRAYLQSPQTLGSCRRERFGPGRELFSTKHRTTLPARRLSLVALPSRPHILSMLSRPPSNSRPSPPPARSSRQRR